jgi:exosome complex protein LRP1
MKELDVLTILQAYLRLHGVQAKEHAVFTELTRVKQYFEKVKATEEGPTKPRQNLSLNKQAAGRIIKHALVCGYNGHLHKPR